MIVSRFGGTWENAYTLSDVEGANDFSVDRPPVVAQAGAAHGVFDLYGDNPYPLQPQTVSKLFSLHANTYAEIDRLVDELKAATIAAGRSKVWQVHRDGTTRRWAWGKCIGLSFSEISKGQKFTLPVRVTFNLPEGLWYGENPHTYTSPTQSGTQLDLTFVNNGILRSPLYLEFSGDSNLFPTITVWNQRTNYEYQLNFATAQAEPNFVIVDAAKWFTSFTYQWYPGYNTEDAYPFFAYGTRDIPQDNWMILEPGANNIRINITATGTPGWTIYAVWEDIYL